MATTNGIRNFTFADSALRLPPGEWVTRRGVRHFVAAPQPVHIWHPEAMRAAHARHTAGDRDEPTLVGERAYQAWRKRVQKARRAENYTEDVAA